MRQVFNSGRRSRFLEPSCSKFSADVRQSESACGSIGTQGRGNFRIFADDLRTAGRNPLPLSSPVRIIFLTEPR